VQQLSESVKQEILDVVEQIEHSYSAVEDEQTRQIEALKLRAGKLGEHLFQPRTTLNLFHKPGNTQSLRHLTPHLPF